MAMDRVRRCQIPCGLPASVTNLRGTPDDGLIWVKYETKYTTTILR
jgi:hypothetical protein